MKPVTHNERVASACRTSTRRLPACGGTALVPAAPKPRAIARPTPLEALTPNRSRIDPDDLGTPHFAVDGGDRQLRGILYDMVVGQDVTPVVDHGTRPHSGARERCLPEVLEKVLEGCPLEGPEIGSGTRGGDGYLPLLRGDSDDRRTRRSATRTNASLTSFASGIEAAISEGLHVDGVLVLRICSTTILEPQSRLNLTAPT